jgi:G3E family GTPase
VQHILRNREGLKIGVVVNDVAEANIDSELLKFEVITLSQRLVI